MLIHDGIYNNSKDHFRIRRNVQLIGLGSNVIFEKKAVLKNIFVVETGVTNLSIQNIKMCGPPASSNYFFMDGYMILSNALHANKLEIKNCSFSFCEGHWGSAVRALNASLDISGCTFDNNSCAIWSNGGGDTVFNVTNCSFTCCGGGRKNPICFEKNVFKDTKNTPPMIYDNDGSGSYEAFEIDENQ